MTIDAIRLFASRNLRPRAVPSGEYPGIPNYYSIVDGERPSWWSCQDERFPEDIVGVLENIPDTSRHALVIHRKGIFVVDDRETSATLLYRDVTDFPRLRKAPIAESIDLKLEDGSTFSVPVLCQSGAIFDVLRFLMSAVHEAHLQSEENVANSP